MQSETKAKTLSVLVVDDVAATRMSLRLDLEQAGHRVECCENGADALQLMRTTPFDALITDLWMPKMDGLALLKAVYDLNPGLRVFVVTGGGPRLPIESAATLAQVWGAAEVFIKPFDNREIVAALQK